MCYVLMYTLVEGSPMCFWNYYIKHQEGIFFFKGTQYLTLLQPSWKWKP